MQHGSASRRWLQFLVGARYDNFDLTALDLNTNATYGAPFPGFVGGNNVDIMFSPSGQVMTPGFVQATINLWVRDVTQPNEVEGDPTIVSVQRQSGLVSAHSPGPPNDVYQYVRDGRSSGRD